MSEAKQPTVNEEQLALFRNHVELQKEELTEQSTKNRADQLRPAGDASQ